MNLDDLGGYVLDTLYSGLTGGSAELPLPQNTIINWVQPGLALHETAFDFAIAGPFAGPSPLTLPYFTELVKSIQGAAAGDGNGDGEPMTREKAIEEAKRLYQQYLLGGWEEWSRLVDFIPLVDPKRSDTQWTAKPGQGSKQHVGIVYAQAGQRLSEIYQDTLERCLVADEELTDQQKTLIERAKALLQEQVEVEDFLTGEKKTEFRDSRVMTAYKDKRIAYENAVIDYATRLARANNGTASDLIEWSRSGGIYKQRANQALRDWIANGYKEEIEKAQATISHILGGSMVAWKDKLTQDLDDIQNNVLGAFGYSFFPAAVIPGGFARSSSWSRLTENELHTKTRSSTTSRDWGAHGGLALGFLNIGAVAGGGSKDEQVSFQQEAFGIDFEYTQVEIVRPAFNPNFFLSRGWKPRDDFVRDHGPLHSDGKEQPKGSMIGYPTKALFLRNLTITSQSLASALSEHEDKIAAGGILGWGPFNLGGYYSQSNKRRESNLDIHGATITVKGLQLVAFLSALFPYSANPSPDVKDWI
jgi:hypothetical protein